MTECVCNIINNATGMSSFQKRMAGYKQYECNTCHLEGRFCPSCNKCYECDLLNSEKYKNDMARMKKSDECKCDLLDFYNWQDYMEEIFVNRNCCNICDQGDPNLVLICGDKYCKNEIGLEQLPQYFIDKYGTKYICKDCKIERGYGTPEFENNVWV